jgi:hypothetical protein
MDRGSSVWFIRSAMSAKSGFHWVVNVAIVLLDEKASKSPSTFIFDNRDPFVEGSKGSMRSSTSR